MRVRALFTLLGLGLGSTALAQEPAWEYPERYYQPPGVYGMAWGSASYGYKLDHSRFNSPYQGGGYGLGLGQYAVTPNAFGQGLWSRGGSSGWQVWPAQQGYRTFAAPGWPGTALPPVGAFAPSLGPPAYQIR